VSHDSAAVVISSQRNSHWTGRTVVGSWVKDCWLALHTSDIAAPQVPMQHTGLDVARNVLKVHLQVVTELVTQLAQPAITCHRGVVWGNTTPAGRGEVKQLFKPLMSAVSA